MRQTDRRTDRRTAASLNALPAVWWRRHNNPPRQRADSYCPKHNCILNRVKCIHNGGDRSPLRERRCVITVAAAYRLSLSRWQRSADASYPAYDLTRRRSVHQRREGWWRWARQALWRRASIGPNYISDIYTYGESDIIPMPAGFRRHLVRNVCHCDFAEIRFVGKLLII